MISRLIIFKIEHSSMLVSYHIVPPITYVLLSLYHLARKRDKKEKR